MASLLTGVVDLDDEDLSGDDSDQEFPQKLSPNFSDLEQDPTPGAVLTDESRSFTRRAAGRLRPPANAAPATKAMRNRVSAELQVYVELLAGGISLRDDLCGTAISDAAKPACDKAAAILCRYPEIAQKLIHSGMLADIAGLALALKQVVTTVVAHHITHTIGSEEEDEIDDNAYPPYRPH